MSDGTKAPPFRWKGINLHELLAQFHIHSVFEDEIPEGASLHNDHNLKVLADIMQQAYEMNR